MINLVPETQTAPPAARRRYIWRSMGTLTIAMISVLALAWLTPEGGVWPVIVGGLLVAGLAFGVYEFVVLMRALDELQQRIHMMALAIGCGGAVMIITALALVAMVLQWGPLEPALTVMFAVAGYYGSLFALSRQYA
ncbi:type IV secretion system protein [Hyphomonadaceae bacterium ML37]|nr:type IV secretion system protein [Hyphomonadaceae bacterium ML37]